MKLLVHELRESGVTQELTPDRNMIVEAVRPHLLRFNHPAGSLKMQILDDTDTLVGESESVNISDIATLNYFHGYVRFYINAGLKKNVAYKFRLLGDGYTFDDASYIGWCNGFDLGKYTPETNPANDLNYPLDIEVWERTVK